jgi:tripartite-type tricarboxylate transporter receptor subunit TctC
MKDFIEAAKAAESAGKPLSYASYGFGVITHFTAERLWQQGGTKLQYVTYRSSPESAVALLGGHVDMAVTAGTAGVATNPAIRIIGVAAKIRRPDLPAVPTLIEQGYDVSLDYISGVLAPAGLPAKIREKLLKAIASANAKYGEELKQDMKKADLIYADIPGDEMRAIWQEREKWFREVAPRLDLKR